jgi:response regulator NasT
VKKAMKQPLRIAVADDEADIRQYLEKTLPLLGHQVVAVARSGSDLVQKCRETRPDLVITDIKMPDLDGIDAASQIFRERPTPVILLSAFHDPELLERAEADHVLAYLVKPIKQADLQPAIGMVMRRFQQFQALHQEAASLRQALEDRKLIERAKGYLMKRAAVTEAEAFRRLQRLATDKRSKLVEIARWIMAVEDASQPEEEVGQRTDSSC